MGLYGCWCFFSAALLPAASGLFKLHPSGLRINIATSKKPSPSLQTGPPSLVCVSTVPYHFLLTSFLRLYSLCCSGENLCVLLNCEIQKGEAEAFLLSTVAPISARAGQRRRASLGHEWMNTSCNSNSSISPLSPQFHTPIPFSQVHFLSFSPSQGGCRGSGFWRIHGSKAVECSSEAHRCQSLVTWVQILTPPHFSCATLGKWFNFSVHPFEHLQSGDDSSAFLQGHGEVNEPFWPVSGQHLFLSAPSAISKQVWKAEGWGSGS